MIERRGTWPALLVEFGEPERREAGTPAIEDLLWAALDDSAPLAVYDLDSAWQIFFDTVSARDRAADAISSLGIGHVIPLEVADEDWARRTQAGLGAVTVGEIVVAPPWAAEEHPGALLILPSTGFGSGHHQSTRLCLALLQRAGARGREVVDVGTGSGILAIAARRLGAARVAALDLDPDALESARENLLLNNCQGEIELRLEDFRNSQLRGDLVLANLTASLLVAGAADLWKMVSPTGQMIVSGFLESDEPAVLAALIENAGTSAMLSSRASEDGWVGLLLYRQE